MWRWPLGRVIFSTVGVLVLLLLCLSGGSTEGVIGLAAIIGGVLILYAVVRAMR